MAHRLEFTRVEGRLCLRLFFLGSLLLGPGAASSLAQTNTSRSPWENEIAAFEAADKTNPPPRDAVLFVGSSSIRLWQTLRQDFANYPVIQRGFGGSQIADSTSFADRIILPYRPKTIVFYAGDNDLNSGKSPEQVRSDFVEFLDKIHRTLPNTWIGFISIKPSRARWPLLDKIKRANDLIREVVQTHPHSFYLDVFTPMLDERGELKPGILQPDGLHLNAQGYRLWSSVINEKLPHLPH